MALTEQIITHRKAKGWSQEELAAQLGVSRQSVSKWESGASVPELDKIVLLAGIFGTTTDALLLDTPAAPVQPIPQEPTPRQVSLSEGKRYLALTEKTARRFAPAAAACVFSPTPLILLTGLAEYGKARISEQIAAGIGVTILLVIVAAAVAVFISGGIALNAYEYMEKETFLPGPGLTAWAKEERENFLPTFSRNLVIGVTLCILGMVPLVLAGTFGASDLILLLLTDVLLWLVTAAVFLFVRSGMVYGCLSQLLQCGDYTPERKKIQKLGGVYWCFVTAIFLAASFFTGRWDKTWLIWCIAGVLYGGFCILGEARQTK